MTGHIPPLTWLYAPGHNARMVQSALRSKADAVVIDLEDAVPPASKEDARHATAELLGSSPPRPVFVRVNGIGSQWGKADLIAIAEAPGLSGLRLPKVEGTAELDTIADLVGADLAIHCLIESALGVERSFDIASHPRVSGLGMGELDLEASLGVSGAGLDWARARVVMAAAAAGLDPPPQSVYPRLNDPEGLAQSCLEGRQIGFWGRSAIHPNQLEVIVRSYLPTRSEYEAANRVLESVAGSPDGEITVLADGRFVDSALLPSARRIVAIAKRHGVR